MLNGSDWRKNKSHINLSSISQCMEIDGRCCPAQAYTSFLAQRHWGLLNLPSPLTLLAGAQSFQSSTYSPMITAAHLHECRNRRSSEPLSRVVQPRLRTTLSNMSLLTGSISRTVMFAAGRPLNARPS
ncbi:MAG: hypothetical protein JWL86_2113 [Rhizobium sp.]|nr:hypothetical protein [Rhizobium sp.]